ncbi:MAG: FAD binding domain-containing protein [Acidimicrobiales bacterium]
MPVLIARSVDEACAALDADRGAVVVAGGTDLMVGVNAGRRPLTSVVTLDRIDALREWHRDGDAVVLGAGLTYTDLAGAELAALVPALAQAARTVGSPQIRNAGTIGGNLATASPAGDTLPVLAALGADVLVQSSSAPRTIGFGDFCIGPKRTALSPGEIIVGVRVPVLDGPQEFLKVGTRNAMVISVASTALVADLAGQQIGIGLGSVGPTVLRAPEAERWVVDHIDWAERRLPDPRTSGTFGDLVGRAARPIDDHRSTADYRRHCVAVLAQRALLRMFPA